MKKFVKTMLVIIAVLAMLGIGFTVAGAAMGATLMGTPFFQKMKSHVQNGEYRVWNWSSDGDWEDDWDETDVEKVPGTVLQAAVENGDTKAFEISDVDSMELNLRYDELNLEEYDGDTIRVEVNNDNNGYVTVKKDSRTLHIISTGKKHDRDVTVFYPKGMKFKTVEIGIDAGAGNLDGDLEAEEFDVSVGAGDFSNSGTIRAENCDITVGVGEADMTGITAENIDGECGIGKLTLSLSGKESDYNYNLECGVGTVNIGENEYSGLAAEKSINNGASKSLDLECGMGEIDVEFED